jgi:hypothetical protein
MFKHKSAVGLFVLQLFLILESRTQVSNEGKYFFSGDVKIDLLASRSPMMDSPEHRSAMNGERKSPLLAAGLSFLLPGAGEYYSESYWKSGFFFAAEVAGITFGLIYNQKGVDQTNYYQRIANKEWSVVKYVEWCRENLPGWDVSDRTTAEDLIDELITSNNVLLPPWQRVDWQKLNAFERAVGGGFSHTLPRYGEQQYFELIGKYQQFRAGWSDFDSTFPGYRKIYDLTVSPKFLTYSKERGKANDFYSVSKRAVNLVLLNHLLSTLDAAWSANSYNAQFSTSFRYEQQQDLLGMYELPVVKLKIVF